MEKGTVEAELFLLRMNISTWMRNFGIDDDTELKPEEAEKMLECFLDDMKPKLFELHRKQNYDNYVTGGGTNKTDKYYKDERIKLSDMGVFWEYIYEEKEVDCNFIK